MFDPNLMVDCCCLVANPLALGFPINAGSVTFTVPDVTPKDNYFAVRT